MVEEKGLTPEQIYNAEKTGEMFSKKLLFPVTKNLLQDSRKQIKDMLFPLFSLLSH